MQMKMDKKRPQTIDKSKLLQILECEDEFISTLFDCFEVPESKEDAGFVDQYLLKTKEKAGKPKPNVSMADQKSSLDMEQRLEIIRNKMKSKKVKPSARAIEKKRQKKLKKSKELKKKIISAAKSIKNEKVKVEKVDPKSAVMTESSNADDVKPDIEVDVKPKLFNEQGSLVFPKFEFAARPSQAKKSKKDKSIKDPKLLLKKLKNEKEQINELVAQGEIDKAEEFKKNIAWKKALDKISGKKVKDDERLLLKKVRQKKVLKKKSKEQWKERGQKVEKDKESKAKKRETNLNKKKDEKKKNKLKKSVKRGRIIPGY